MKVRIAVVQPVSEPFGAKDTEERLDRAEEYVKDAVGQGASIVCFPEHYPGPVQSSASGGYPYRERLSVIARNNQVYLIAGAIEKAEGTDGLNVIELIINKKGEIIGKYIRTTPKGPYVYEQLGLNYLEGDGPLDIYDTEYGRIGVVICSEMFAPELSRILALKGAEILFYPVGGSLAELTDSFQTIVKARAIENLMYTATCCNIFGVEDGVSLITGPEGLIAKSTKPGVLVAELDLDRIRYLRNTEEVLASPKKYRTLPGVLQWRRPDLYKKNYSDW